MMNFNIDPTSTNNNTDQVVTSVLSTGALQDSLETTEHASKRTRKARTGPKTSQYIGVSSGNNGVWIAQYKINNKTIYIGTFYTEALAAASYDANLFAKMLNGTITTDITRLNFGNPRLDATKETLAKLGIKAEDIIIKDNEQNQESIKLKRCAPQTAQARNKTSIFRGVSWYDKRQCWKASVQTNKQKIYIGKYATAEDGARAYNAKVKELAVQEPDPKLRNKLLGNLYEVPNTETKTPANYNHATTTSTAHNEKSNGPSNDSALDDEALFALTNPLSNKEFEALYNEAIYDETLFDNDDWLQEAPGTNKSLLFTYDPDDDFDWALICPTPPVPDQQPPNGIMPGLDIR